MLTPVGRRAIEVAPLMVLIVPCDVFDLVPSLVSDAELCCICAPAMMPFLPNALGLSRCTELEREAL